MQKTPNLDALSAVEQAGILTTLLRTHPELAREAEAIAAERLAEEDSDAVAGQIARGMLAGLYACRDEDDNDLVLTHAGMPDAVDDLAHTVLAACAKGGVAVPEQWLADNCPAWTANGVAPAPRGRRPGVRPRSRQ